VLNMAGRVCGLQGPTGRSAPAVARSPHAAGTPVADTLRSAALDMPVAIVALPSQTQVSGARARAVSSGDVAEPGAQHDSASSSVVTSTISSYSAGRMLVELFGHPPADGWPGLRSARRGLV
jgi:hypothetical protein